MFVTIPRHDFYDGGYVCITDERFLMSTAIERACGLTAEDYDKQLESQGGGCAICEKRPGHGKRLCWDHEHRTGLVRGLLCDSCNYDLLGCFGDTSRAARKFTRAAGYIDNPPAMNVIGVKRHKDAPPIKENYA